MSKLYSNELKALVAVENVLEMSAILQDHCMTVQRFDYDCERERNSSGETYGPTNPVVLEFTIRVNDPADARPFYSYLTSNSHFQLSFLFNATFNDNKRLKDYEDGMVVDGYVVSVDEDYSASKNELANDEQMLLTVKVLLLNTTYLGIERNYKSIFIHH